MYDRPKPKGKVGSMLFWSNLRNRHRQRRAREQQWEGDAPAVVKQEGLVVVDLNGNSGNWGPRNTRNLLRVNAGERSRVDDVGGVCEALSAGARRRGVKTELTITAGLSHSVRETTTGGDSAEDDVDECVATLLPVQKVSALLFIECTGVAHPGRPAMITAVTLGL